MPGTITGTSETKLWQNYRWWKELLGRASVLEGESAKEGQSPSLRDWGCHLFLSSWPTVMAKF
jgi:hypothetical protein